MENNWSPVSFSDAVNLNPTVKLTKGEEYPFVDMKSVDPAWREVTFSELRAFKSGGAKFIPKDTLMARITPCLENGKIARYLPAGKKGEAFGSTEFIVIRGKDGVTDNDFAYYLTMWPEFRDFAISQMTGSSGRQRVPVDSLAGFNFNLPPLTEQRAIAHVLGSLDDKIKLNRRMNETLEAMAQVLFKSWFIDFDPALDNAILAGNPIPDALEERAEIRRAILAQNQPSPPAPLPEVEGSNALCPHPQSFSQSEKDANYRGGFDFSGLADTARELRQKQTPAEKVMWSMLRNRNFMGLKFRRQHQIGEYIADFYCHEEKLVVELDGKIHEQKIAKDQKRNAYMQSIGLIVLRFTNEQFLSDPEVVLNDIANVLQKEKSEKLQDHNSSSPTGRGGSEGFSDSIRKLFPSEFEHTEEMGWIPKEWTTQPLYEIANFINGAAYKNFHFTDEPGALPVVKIAEIKNGVSAQTKFTKTELADKYRIDDGDILFSWSGNPDTSIDTFVWTGGPGWLNQHIFNVSLNDDADRNFVYYQLKLLRPDFAEIARNKQTTGLGHVTAQDMKRMHVTKCPSSILQAFNTYAGSLFDRWYSNLLAIKNKSKLRDTLLPKLLSGEIRIPEAEKLIKSVNGEG